MLQCSAKCSGPYGPFDEPYGLGFAAAISANKIGRGGVVHACMMELLRVNRTLWSASKMFMCSDD